MKVKLLKDCYVEGEPCVKGQVVDTTRGWLLIGCGKATQDVEEKKVKRSPTNRKVDDVEVR